MTDRLEEQRRLSIKQVFERWATSELTPHIRGDGKRIGRKDGGQYVREQFERRIFPIVGEVPIADIRKPDILGILDSVKAEGKLRTANVLLADLKQMFRFAVEREIIEHSPIELIQKRKIGGKDVERDRALSDDELRTLAFQLTGARLTQRTEIAIWLILATGCRIGELIGTVWADCKAQEKNLVATVNERNIKQKSGGIQLGFVDLAMRTWYLPTTKNQRDHTIHLSEFAVKLFSKLAAQREVSKIDGKLVPWIFSDKTGLGPVCVKSIGKQLADRQRSTNKPMKNRTKSVDSLLLSGGHWTAHDLRRTTSTMMSRLGIPKDVIDECENHIKQGMSRLYIQDRREAEQAKAFDMIGAKLEKIIKNQQSQ